MTEELTKKGWFFISRYCRYARKKNGRSFYHPTDSCQTYKCDNIPSDKRHPKNTVKKLKKDDLSDI